MIRVHQWVARGRRLQTWHKVAIGVGVFVLLVGGSVGLGAVFADKNPEVVNKPARQVEADDSSLLPSKAYQANEDDDDTDTSSTSQVQGTTTTPTAPTQKATVTTPPPAAPSQQTDTTVPVVPDNVPVEEPEPDDPNPVVEDGANND